MKDEEVVDIEEEKEEARKKQEARNKIFQSRQGISMR